MALRVAIEVLHSHAKDLEVQQRISCRRLRGCSIRDQAVEDLQLQRVRILVVFDDPAFSEGPIVVLGDVQGDWQTLYVRGVVLHTHRFVGAAQLEMGIEARHIVEAALVRDSKILISVKHAA